MKTRSPRRASPRRGSAAAPPSPPAPALDDPTLHLFCHDFRVPLTSVAAYAELLRGADLSATQREEFAAAVEIQARRLARMVDDLESLAEDERAAASTAGEVPVIDLGERIAAALEMVEPLARARGVGIVLETPRTPVIARTRYEELDRALVWVLEATLRRAQHGKEIRVRPALGRATARAEVDLPAEHVDAAEIAALRDYRPGAGAPPDLIRGIAGPLWVALQNFKRAGGLFELHAVRGGLRWSLVVPSALSVLENPPHSE